MPKPTVTVYVKRLEAAGFVRREIDAADLRRHRLVTHAGRPQGAVARARIVVGGLGARLERLSAAERTALQRLLEKLA